MHVRSNDVREVLKDRLPSLSSSQLGRPELWNENPVDNYAIFGEVVRPYLFTLLRSTEKDEELKEIFCFLEEIAGRGSYVLLDVLQLEIIVPLAHAKTERDVAQKYMGAKFKQLLAHARRSSVTLWLAKMLGRLRR